MYPELYYVTKMWNACTMDIWEATLPFLLCYMQVSYSHNKCVMLWAKLASCGAGWWSVSANELGLFLTVLTYHPPQCALPSTSSLYTVSLQVLSIVRLPGLLPCLYSGKQKTTGSPTVAG